MVAPDFDQFVERYHQALDEFFRGNPNPAKALYSHLEDATLANPFGPVAIGWELVAEAMERAAANYRDGEAATFVTLSTHVTPDLAYLVEVERFRAKVGGSEEVVSACEASEAGGDTAVPSPVLSCFSLACRARWVCWKSSERRCCSVSTQSS